MVVLSAERGLRPATGPAARSIRRAPPHAAPCRALSITTRYAATPAVPRRAPEATRTRDRVTHSRLAHSHTCRSISLSCTINITLAIKIFWDYLNIFLPDLPFLKDRKLNSDVGLANMADPHEKTLAWNVMSLANIQNVPVSRDPAGLHKELVRSLLCKLDH